MTIERLIKLMHVVRSPHIDLQRRYNHSTSQKWLDIGHPCIVNKENGVPNTTDWCGEGIFSAAI